MASAQKLARFCQLAHRRPARSTCSGQPADQVWYTSRPPLPEVVFHNADHIQVIVVKSVELVTVLNYLQTFMDEHNFSF